jgi:hypothetical protein
MAALASLYPSPYSSSSYARSLQGKKDNEYLNAFGFKIRGRFSKIAGLQGLYANTSSRFSVGEIRNTTPKRTISVSDAVAAATNPHRRSSSLTEIFSNGFDSDISTTLGRPRAHSSMGTAEGAEELNTASSKLVKTSFDTTRIVQSGTKNCRRGSTVPRGLKLNAGERAGSRKHASPRKLDIVNPSEGLPTRSADYPQSVKSPVENTDFFNLVQASGTYDASAACEHVPGFACNTRSRINPSVEKVDSLKLAKPRFLRSMNSTCNGTLRAMHENYQELAVESLSTPKTPLPNSEAGAFGCKDESGTSKLISLSKHSGKKRPTIPRSSHLSTARKAGLRSSSSDITHCISMRRDVHTTITSTTSKEGEKNELSSTLHPKFRPARGARLEPRTHTASSSCIPSNQSYPTVTINPVKSRNTTGLVNGARSRAPYNVALDYAPCQSTSEKSSIQKPSIQKSSIRKFSIKKSTGKSPYTKTRAFNLCTSNGVAFKRKLSAKLSTSPSAVEPDSIKASNFTKRPHKWPSTRWDLSKPTTTIILPYSSTLPCHPGSKIPRLATIAHTTAAELQTMENDVNFSYLTKSSHESFALKSHRAPTKSVLPKTLGRQAHVLTCGLRRGEAWKQKSRALGHSITEKWNTKKIWPKNRPEKGGTLRTEGVFGPVHSSMSTSHLEPIPVCYNTTHGHRREITTAAPFIRERDTRDVKEHRDYLGRTGANPRTGAWSSSGDQDIAGSRRDGRRWVSDSEGWTFIEYRTLEGDRCGSGGSSGTIVHTTILEE